MATRSIDASALEDLSEDERKELMLDLILALVDKHELTIAGLTEMATQLIMQHGVRDAAKFV